MLDLAFPHDWYPPVDSQAALAYAATKVGPDEIQSIRGSTALLGDGFFAYGVYYSWDVEILCGIHENTENQIIETKDFDYTVDEMYADISWITRCII